MKKAFFITGTDTNIGKTIVSAWLAHHLQASYWKPIQTGCLMDDDSKTVECLTHMNIINPVYKLKAPLSPYNASLEENIIIDFDRFNLPEHQGNLIVEGAGGLMVPITKDYNIIDLIKKLEIPIIIVASSGLGTINHTCLTVKVAELYNLKIAGIILNGKKNQANKEAIELFTGYEVLAELEQLDNIADINKITLPEKLYSRIYEDN